MDQADWWYAVGGQKRGPVPPAVLRSLLEGGVLTRTSLVWHQGMLEWEPLQRVPEFKDQGLDLLDPLPPQPAGADGPGGGWRRLLGRFGR